MGILPMIHGHDARATAKEYVNIYLGRNTRKGQRHPIFTYERTFIHPRMCSSKTTLILIFFLTMIF